MSDPTRGPALRTENREGATFTDRTRAIVVTLAIVSLVATIATIVFGRTLAPPPAQPRDSYGRGPLGHRAWAETMQALGVHVVRWTRTDYGDVSAPLFLVEPDRPEFQAEDGTRVSIAGLCASRAEAGRMTVIVLPKWVIGAFGQVGPELPGRVHDVLAGTPFESAQVVWQPRITAHREEIRATSSVLGERQLALPWPQTVVGPQPLLSGPTGTFIAADPSGRTFVISDPDLLHNFDVQRVDHAAVLHDFVTEVLHADTIVVDEVFHEHVQTRSLAELFAHFPGLLALVHGALAILVVLFYGRRRFGPPRSEPAPYGRGPREVIDVAAGVLASGQTVENLAPRYVEQVILDAHRRLGLSGVVREADPTQLRRPGSAGHSGRLEGKTLAQKAAALDGMLTRRGLTPDAVRLLHTSQSATRETALSVAARATRLRESLLGAPKTTPAPRRPQASVPPPPPIPPPPTIGEPPSSPQPPASTSNP